MSDRYRVYPAASRSSAAFNPARSSLPNAIGGGYNPGYASEGEYVVSPTRYAAANTPRAYPPPAASAAAAAASANPSPRPAYVTKQEPRPPRPATREPSRNRRSTLESTRPPIIVTTTQDHPKHNPPPSYASSGGHGHAHTTHQPSPIRDNYRSSDGKLYTQPASSIRTRSTARPYHIGTSNEDSPRPRDRELVLAGRDADAYRSARPSVTYPSDPRHSNAAIDYGEEGYQYTNAGDLVRYDLDHGVPARRRQESFDKGYHRPNINYNADQRSFNVNTGYELARHYSTNSRPHDGRGGPPPTTRGFDKINRVRDVPPAVPIPPSPSASGHIEPATPVERRETRRPRPVSLTQDPGVRIPQPEDYYRSFESDGKYERPRFYDDSVTSRGFGLRPNGPAEPEDRQHPHTWDLKRDDPQREDSRESPRAELRRRESQKLLTDEEHKRESDQEREDWYRGYKDGHDIRKEEEVKVEADETNDRPSVRDRIATGLGIAASAVGLGGPRQQKSEEKEIEQKEIRRRQSFDDSQKQRRGSESRTRMPGGFDWESGPRESSRPDRPESRGASSSQEQSRRASEDKLNGETAVVSSDSEEGRQSTRRRRASSVFDPNDTHDLKQLKEQFAAMSTSDGEKSPEKETPEANERESSSSPVNDEMALELVPREDESRGRDLVLHGTAGKQVRVVSPPKIQKDKPLKGILKQPKSSFPEERNPVREGVAPHKDDKKIKDAPPGAKWTKINRKVVNPEALEIGKERFEVRDDFVIVLRVLSKEEIQSYAAATQVLRERRRNKENADRERDREMNKDYDYEYGRDAEDDRMRKQSQQQLVRRDEDEEAELDDRERGDRERRRRRRRDDDDDEYEGRSRDAEQYRSNRDRE